MGGITSLGRGMKYLSWRHLLRTAASSEPKNLGTERDCEATFCPLRGPACPVPPCLARILNDMTLPHWPLGSFLHVGHCLSAAGT